MKSTHQILLLSSFLFLSACSGFALKKDSKEETQKQVSVQDEEIQYKDFDIEKDTLHDLLVAEIAAQRNEFNITLLNYLQQSHITRDPDIIRRAINAAQYLKDYEAVKEMAHLWVEVSPESVPAHQMLAFQYSVDRDYEQAMHHIDNILTLKGDARADSLAITASSLPENEREILLEQYQKLHEKHPNNHEVTYSLALVQKSLKRYDEALQIIEPVFAKAPDFEALSVLKTDILFSKGELQQALDFAEDKFEDFPKNHNLGRLYATMLVQNKQLDDAENVFKSLIESYPQAARLKLSLAIVQLENKKVDEAKALFIELSSDATLGSAAHFYLARIAEAQKDIPLAIEHYQKVSPGPHFDNSLERSIYLMVDSGLSDEVIEKLAGLRSNEPNNALKYWLLQVKVFSSFKDEERTNQALDQAIQAFPDDEQLLYARAMNREADDDLAGMEADLRVLIEKDPENAIAINALGYTLADRTDRLDEAFALIQKAVSLKPENPAILDSMGWVLFKLGKNKEALVFLLKAFQKFQDGEIAAHLGEVLMSLNQTTEAREIWGAIFLKQPEHKVLNETISRLDPEFYAQLKQKHNEYLEHLKNTNEQSSTDSAENVQPDSNTDSSATTKEMNIEKTKNSVETNNEAE